MMAITKHINGVTDLNLAFSASLSCIGLLADLADFVESILFIYRTHYLLYTKCRPKLNTEHVGETGKSSSTPRIREGDVVRATKPIWIGDLDINVPYGALGTVKEVMDRSEAAV